MFLSKIVIWENKKSRGIQTHLFIKDCYIPLSKYLTVEFLDTLGSKFAIKGAIY